MFLDWGLARSWFQCSSRHHLILSIDENPNRCNIIYNDALFSQDNLYIASVYFWVCLCGASRAFQLSCFKSWPKLFFFKNLLSFIHEKCPAHQSCIFLSMASIPAFSQNFVVYNVITQFSFADWKQAKHLEGTKLIDVSEAKILDNGLVMRVQCNVTLFLRVPMYSICSRTDFVIGKPPVNFLASSSLT